MKACGITDKGRVRRLNEDYYYLPEFSERFIAVADGMGGHAAGEVASFIAVKHLAASLRKAPCAGEARLLTAIEEANSAVYAAANSDVSREGMGTTLTALWFSGNIVYLGHVGDSRAYRLRDGKLTQLSEDHSYVEELVKSGVITREQARTHPKRNLITRCIGVFNAIDPQIVKLDHREADRYLLCSDGLAGSVSDREIEDTLNMDDISPIRQLGILRDLALRNGSTDNITIAFVSGGDNA